MDIVSAFASVVRVTEARSFSAVGRELDLSKAAGARQISHFGRHFGVRLLDRLRRRLNLIDDGQMPPGLAKPVFAGYREHRGGARPAERRIAEGPARWDRRCFSETLPLAG